MRYLTSRLQQSLIKSLFSIISLALSLAVFSSVASAQAPGTRRLPENLPIGEATRQPAPTALGPAKVATGSALYCAGFFNATPTPNNFQIVGAEQEDTRQQFAQGDIVYLNVGRSQGLEPEMLFAIVRPLGDFRSPFVHTSGQRKLGVYTRELGVLRVIAVQEKTATARIIVSCEEMQFGDLLRPFEERRAPAENVSQPLPRYEPTSGQKAGRIVFQREQKEMIAPRDVVYIDLGKDNGINVGDRFTIYRQYPNDAKSVRINDDDITQRRSGGYQSDTYKGGTFSIDHPRVARQDVKNARPQLPHKIVGELVVISVQGKSATAIVTRTTQEVHPGDWIEAR